MISSASFSNLIHSLALLAYIFVHFPSTSKISSLSLHDALPISHLSVVLTERRSVIGPYVVPGQSCCVRCLDLHRADQDRKSTRLNSSHVAISYAVFCLQKKSD